MAKSKAKFVLVALRSLITGHQKVCRRERLGDKLEFVGYDPYVRQRVVYKEVKKLRSIK